MTRVEIETPVGPAWADIDRPSGDPIGVFYAGHGAGGGVESPDVRAARDGALAAGYLVARITQPYRVAGRRTPPPAPRLDEAWLAATAALHEQLGGALPVVHCGRSSGARVACRTAAATGAVAVVALAFPLHPPGKPERSRLAELDAPTVPVLVVQGDRDAFGMPPPDPRREIVVIPGDTHALKKDPRAVAAAVRAFLVEHVPQPR
jgi:predicted alpha/beta-hydrolase family hydrolase